MVSSVENSQQFSKTEEQIKESENKSIHESGTSEAKKPKSSAFLR